MRIAVTPGEPSGIGPELLVRQAQLPNCGIKCGVAEARELELVAIADPTLLMKTAQTLDLPLNLHTFNTHRNPQQHRASGEGQLSVQPVSLASPATPGCLNVANAPYVLETLSQATQGCTPKSSNSACLDPAHYDALVTGPVQKSVINDAGIPFSGHTEFFAEKADNVNVVMMLATEGLRVALATTHLPLKDVAARITREGLTQTLTILLRDLRTQFGIAEPRVLVCGLNPHAGEGGHLGHEEIDIIQPIIKHFQQQGAKLIGPLPADTLFTEHHLQNTDAVLAMYHDQGLPVLKYKGFGKAVNITLGLPFIRTSVDHGTALDLAGKGMADLGSMQVALQTAYTMVKSSKGRIQQAIQ